MFVIGNGYCGLLDGCTNGGKDLRCGKAVLKMQEAQLSVPLMMVVVEALA